MAVEFYCESLPLPPSLIALLRSGMAMRKDDDFLRALLFELDESEDWLHHISFDDGDNPEMAKRYFHAMLLADAGALAVNGKYLDMFRIRDQGYTLIGVMRDDNAWAKVRGAAGSAGRHGVAAMVQVATELVQQQIKSAMGLS